jgi:ketosteroid isomerase-like protein
MKIVVALALAVFAALATAQEPSKQDAAAIRAVVTEQLDAFRRDDGPRAFSLATAVIRARFGAAEVFMQMVRTAYPVVYRPQSVQFETPEVVDGTVIQPVRMTDADGRAWIALYPMERQPDGGWRINGCQLARLQGRET